MKNILLYLYFACLAASLAAQDFVPGESYFGTNNYVEYVAGNLPLVFSAPHGGDLTPAEIPDRDCDGCTYVKDSYTQELSRELAAALHEATGCYPHLIINRLHRRKLDANRDLAEAADGNPAAAQAWQEFHAFIDTAKAQFGNGLYLDLHGHAHTIQRIELGYLLTASELQMSDSALNSPALVAESSVKNLAGSNPGSFSHAELLRGEQSFGSLLEAKNYPAVPSDNDQHPLPGEAYFNGGYNTARHGSKQGGAVDGIQMECNQDVRFVQADRLKFADSLAQVILTFLEKHYLPGSAQNLCSTMVALAFEKRASAVFPNPACEELQVSLPVFPLDIHLVNAFGQVVKSCHADSRQAVLDLKNLPGGIYCLLFSGNGSLRGSWKIIKNCP